MPRRSPLSGTACGLWLLGFSAIPSVAQVESPPARFPSDLEPIERAALYGESIRFPTVRHGPFELKVEELSARVGVPARMADPGSRSLQCSGQLRWSAEAGDFLLYGIATPREASDGLGDSFLNYWEPSPHWVNNGVDWRVDAYRNGAEPEESAIVTLEFQHLRALPQRVGVIAAEVPMWRVVDPRTFTIPLELTQGPVSLLPDWTAEVFAEQDHAGTAFVVVRVAYWGERTEVIPGMVSVPHVLGPEACDWLGVDGQRDRSLTWYPTRVTPAEAREFAERGATVWRWGFRTTTGEFPTGRSIRIRLVNQLQYDPIPFEIREIPLTEESPLPDGASVPKRSAERGVLRLEFSEQSQSQQLFEQVPGEAHATINLRGTLLCTSSAEPLGFLLSPIVSVAENQAGQSFADGYIRPAESLSRNRLLDWSDVEQDYSGPRQMQVTMSFQVDPQTAGIGRLLAEVPIWRATEVAEHQLEVQTSAQQVAVEPGVGVQVSVHPSPDGVNAYIKIRVDVDEQAAIAGLPVPWVTHPVLLRAGDPNPPSEFFVRGDGSGEGSRWIEYDLTTSMRTLQTENPAIRLRIVRGVAYEPLAFELTDFPLVTVPGR